MKPKPVILIDDDIDDLDIMVRACLEISADHPVIAFSDAAHALEYLEENHADAFFILSQNRMSKMTGIDLRRELIRLDGYLDDIPFYLVSSGTTDEKEQAMKLNIRGYFVKPDSFTGIYEMMQMIYVRAGKDRQKNKRIVVIDDDKEDLEMTKNILTDILPDAEVQLFSDPVRALHFLEESFIDPILIISDINMPKMDGYQLRLKILKLPGTIKNVPFVILSTADMGWQLELSETFKIMSCCKKANSMKGMKNTMQKIINEIENS